MGSGSQQLFLYKVQHNTLSDCQNWYIPKGVNADGEVYGVTQWDGMRCEVFDGKNYKYIPLTGELGQLRKSPYGFIDAVVLKQVRLRRT